MDSLRSLYAEQTEPYEPVTTTLIRSKTLEKSSSRVYWPSALRSNTWFRALSHRAYSIAPWAITDSGLRSVNRSNTSGRIMVVPSLRHSYLLPYLHLMLPCLNGPTTLKVVPRRAKQRWALLASNPPRDSPADGAPMVHLPLGHRAQGPFHSGRPAPADTGAMPAK